MVDKEWIFKRASFASKYIFFTLTFIVFIFLFSYFPNSTEGPDSYRKGIDPSHFSNIEFWIVILFLWVGVFFKPKFFIFW
jgi:hypothetical protein|tara:strand:- start:281 stop:520 length:240 start_codon:yes stop_codon:yes gene_type:complete